MLFDMDGVLVDSAGVSNRRLTESARRHGVHLTPEELESLQGTSGPQFWGYIKRAYDLPGTPEEYWASYDAEGEVAEYDPSLIAGGIHRLLDLLRSEAIRIGLVTSASRRRTEKVLDFLDVRALLDSYVCADDVPEHKPDPAPYLAAAKRLDVAPESCLVIEDSHRGVRSAVAAGMAAAVFTGFATDAEAVRWAVGTIHDFALETPETLRSTHRRAAPSTEGMPR